MTYRYRKRREDDDWKDEFDEFFENFGFDFDKLNERILKTWDRMLKDPDVSVYGPYVYGFTYKIGPDGKPKFEEFGNVAESEVEGSLPKVEKDVREPITDLNVDKNRVYITYELPGISKDDVELSVAERSVVLSVKNGPRKYHKHMDFEYDLKPESASAKFVNGILDLTIERAGKDTGTGRRISIN